MQVAFQEFQEGGVLHQSPIPVSKKIKLSSSAIPPSFEIPLHDAVIQEGEKFTFECRYAYLILQANYIEANEADKIKVIVTVLV